MNFPKTNMTFKPATYWPESLTQEQLISRIEGKERQDIARSILNNEGFAGLTAFIAGEELNEEERQAWGNIHPMFMGGEHLPSLDEGEVEIVRISLQSTIGDQISIRAKQQNGMIVYRVASEHDDNEDMRYQIPFDRSEEPLTLEEMVKLIDGSFIPGDIYSGGLVISNWQCSFDSDHDLELAMQFVSTSSNFYPQLEAYYETVAKEWKAAQESEGEEGYF